MNERTDIPVEDLSEPLTFPVDAYTSREYAEAEADKLWAKVWQHAGRVEEIPSVGDYLTYEICHDSILIVRTAPNSIKAYHNVCPHRGRRLVRVPEGANGARGNAGKQLFFCGYHGWSFNLEGENAELMNREDWQGTLTDERTCLAESLIEAAIREGLPHHAAESLVHQTLRGSGELLSTSDKSAFRLRGEVTSPGGTTAAAMHVLEEGGFRALIEDAVQAAAQRSRGLGEKAIET